MPSTSRSTNRQRRSCALPRSRAKGRRTRRRRARTRRRKSSGAWSRAPRTTSPPAIFFRSCCRSALRRRSRCRRSRSTARYGASTLRRICSFSILAPSRSPDRAPRSWSRRATVSSPSAPLPARAEHLMLLDLGRNDVGRVAEIGSVKVTDQFFIERYSQVMHIVSNVEGRLSSKHDSIDALAAGFPAGTVSGAPKVRAMEIIDELEKEKRGLYAGAVGYFSAAGDMDTAIVLRTALVKDGTMYVQAGAGIVADSNPKAEQQECVNKAKALFRAAEEARRFASSAGRAQ